ncbi:sarcolemmal membrane-associated protein isoform X2 [Drosophila ficusphila]|uniref:sarcolemmal membrane-associated protein isoform X2 n=1 Tax=Drosophila ficusphila TaxID=30025 RepID=UPI0007E61BEC|nr:sarcolemmal membrane-associated protein isoform X2 [Drosophila ficusphila]
MVLVRNEWLNNKDDDQKLSPLPPTSASRAVGAVALSSGGTPTDLVTVTPEASIPGNGGEVASTVNRRKAEANTSMESTKLEQEQLFHVTEKHDLYLVESNNDESTENQENNNIHFSDSSTKTLLGSCGFDHRLSAQMPAGVSQQLLHMSMNPAATANIGGPAADCEALPVVSVTQPASVDQNTGAELGSAPCTGDAKIVLQCEAKSHKFDTRYIFLQPNQECKVGRLIAKSKANEGNAIFDCKVLSRNHAMLWYTPDGRFWVKDTKSSNGTFINDNKLGNDPAELHYGDIVKFGVEVIENSRQEVHGCIIARVTLFLPDGREAISIEADQMLFTGQNRISFDEIQRLNSFLQEAAQRERTLKAKLSSLQGVLDSTRKNSAMCWQSMITEDQLLHKINLLEKKLQMMEKNVPENALRNEIVKLLEDKTTYQMTAKEALRKVYQERCDAMQMLSKIEIAYATSENECGILRNQIVISKQTLQDFNTRLEQLQQENVDYKQESLRQQQEAKEHEERGLELLKEKLFTQERELDELRLKVSQLQQSTATNEIEQKYQEQNVLKQINAIISDEYGEKEKTEHHGREEESSEKNHLIMDIDQQTTASIKENKKSSVIRLLKNSDLSKGDEGAAVLKAIFNNEDDDSEDEIREENAGMKQEAAKSHEELNSIPELYQKSFATILDRKLESQETQLVEGNHCIPPDLPTEQAIEMLQEECDSYKIKTVRLTSEIHSMHEQIEMLKKQLELEIAQNEITKLQKNKKESGSGISEQLQITGQDGNEDIVENAWNEDISALNNSLVEQEEELIVYKERLENSESCNLQLRNEISQLHLEQQHLPPRKHVLLHRALPLGCIAIAVFIYFIFNRT